MNCRSKFGRRAFNSLVVLGIGLAWMPTVALGYFWLRWFRFFISINDYGENDFGTIFYVVLGLVVTGGTVVCGILSAGISVGIVRGMKTATTQRVESAGS